MFIQHWIKRWTVASLFIIVIAWGCGTYLLWLVLEDNREFETKYAINEVRLQTNEMLLYLEGQHNQLLTDSTKRDNLWRMAQERNIDLLFTGLDGTVIFNSNKIDSTRSINLRTSLHYDIYTSKMEDDRYMIAFPVIDEGNQNQVGHAIFRVPASLVVMKKSNTGAQFYYVILSSFLLLLLFLLLHLKVKVGKDILKPIEDLKNNSEAILKGNYEQRTIDVGNGEIGECYATFDQMRSEIMYLHQQKINQERAQKELISTISHDIKTPLTTIKAYIDAIGEGVYPDTKTLMEYVEVMQVNTNKMARLVDDLLIHALRELGQISVQPKEQYSRDLLTSMFKPIYHYVRSTGVILHEPTEIPNVLIKIDAQRIEQVISNLISNALKHTIAGDMIHVSIELVSEQLKISISDTGKGIKPLDMPFIFERYFRGTSSSNPNEPIYDGAGLGLSICKMIIEEHGGAISFRSRKDQGTVFYFTLPVC